MRGKHEVPTCAFHLLFFVALFLSSKMQKHSTQISLSPDPPPVPYGAIPIPLDPQRRNLWTTNGWARWKIKALFTSRPCGLEGTRLPSTTASTLDEVRIYHLNTYIYLKHA